MPVYDYICYTCKKKEDVLVKWDKKDEVVCATCSNLMARQLSAPLRTPGRWGDTGGGYDRALGRHFNNSMEKEKYLRANGLVAASDVGGKSFVDDVVAKEEAKHYQHEKDISTFKDILSTTGDASRAYADTFSVDALKGKGLLDSDIASGV